MSDRVEAKLLTMLSGPLESPYGNPIPGLEELGGPAADAASFRSGLTSLPDALAGADAATPVTLVVRRLGERLQIDVDLMRRFAQAGVRPGTAVAAVRKGSGVALTAVEVPVRSAARAGVAATSVAAVGAPGTGAPPVDGAREVAPALHLPLDVARHVFVEPGS